MTRPVFSSRRTCGPLHSTEFNDTGRLPGRHCSTILGLVRISWLLNRAGLVEIHTCRGEVGR